MAAAAANRRVVLTCRPSGRPTPDCFDVVTQPVGVPGEGEVLVAVSHLSVDAFIRTSLDEVSYHPPVPLGGTVVALGVGRVVASEAPTLRAGDAVFGPLGAQTHACLPAGLLQRVDEQQAPLRAYLGVLGLTSGLTAYFGVRAVGCVRKGETVVVSAAAGAVGSLAGQIAAHDGGRVIGIAGGADKVAYLCDALGFAGAIDYKSEDVAVRLRALAPEGVDVYFDNVGGELLDVVLDQIRPRARVVVCGAISQYDHMKAVRGPSLYLRLAERHARMEGFAVTHFQERFAEASAALASWLADERIELREHIETGIERFPAALEMLFDGGHIGKLLVSVSPDADEHAGR